MCIRDSPAVLNRPNFVEAAPTLPRRSPRNGCLQLHPTATTARQRRSPTSIRTYSASWRTARSNNQRSRGSRTKLVTDTRRSTIETATTPGSPVSISFIRGGHHGHANLFHLLVPGGRWETLICTPSSLASLASSTFHRRSREPLEPPASAVMSSLVAPG